MRLSRGWREAAAFVVLYEVYETARSHLHPPAGPSFRHAQTIIDAERALGLYQEHRIQQAFINHKTFLQLWDIYYGTIHFVVPAVALWLLWHRRPDRYRQARTVFLVMCYVALVVFAVWPLMPPRYLPAHYGFVDTAARYGGLGPLDSGSMKDTNPFAAMPSLHIGWSVWSAWVLVPLLSRRPLRILAAVYPLVTLTAIVVTANHWILDGVGGVAAFGVGLGLVNATARLGWPDGGGNGRVEGHDGRILRPAGRTVGQHRPGAPPPRPSLGLRRRDIRNESSRPMTSDSSAPEPIPLYRPLVESEEVTAGSASLAAGWLGMGRSVLAFEEAVHRAIDGGSRSVAAVSTGHAALHLAMLVTGAGPGTEVIVPSLTHLADVQAVLAVGAEPVFCDVDPLTLCIDIDRAAELVGPATRTLLLMDYGPHLCDHDAGAALASERGLRVVHDAAHAFGSAYHGRPVGSFSDVCIFSFDAVKALTAVDAGIVVVRDEIELHRLHHLRLLGSDQPAEAIYRNEKTWDYDAVDIGYRYHLSNVHAAVGLAQIAKLDRIRTARQAACRRYHERLKTVDGVQLPPSDFDEVNPFLYYIRVDPTLRDDLREHLADRGIGTGVHWRPAHLHTRFAAFRRGPLPVTERAGEEIISLPLHSAMSVEVVDRVCDEVAAYFRGPARPGTERAQPASAADQRRYSA